VLTRWAEHIPSEKILFVRGRHENQTAGAQEPEEFAQQRATRIIKHVFDCLDTRNYVQRVIRRINTSLGHLNGAPPARTPQKPRIRSRDAFTGKIGADHLSASG
jgi:hypothetical protein